MPKRKRVQREHTEDWQPVQLWFFLLNNVE